MSRPNVLLLTIDSLRADHVGTRGLTPHIDALGERGVVFESAFAQSVHTALSVRSILSGHYPSTFGDWFGVLSPQRPMLAELLQLNGYHTHGFHSNPYVSRYRGFNRGFDVFDDHMPDVSQPWLTRKALSMFARVRAVIKEPYENAETMNRQVAASIAAARSPWFVWAHYMDVHGPYISKQGSVLRNRLSGAMLWKKAVQSPAQIEPAERERLLGWYAEEIAWLDERIGELLRHVDLENTIVIVSADHGDLFGEHDLYGHSVRMYNGLLQVPLIVSLPGGRSATPRVTHPVGLHDLVPSLVDFLGLETGQRFEGESFARFLRGQDGADPDRPVISEWHRQHLCVSTARYKLLVDYELGLRELYDLSRDRLEQRNLADERPEEAARLEEIIRRHLQSHSGEGKKETLAEDEAIKERLKALGYMD